MARLGETNESSEGPMSALSRSPVERSEHRLLGDLGVMAVQSFFGSGLEARHHGDYVMVEVDSGDYFVGRTPEEALRQAQAAHPGKAFYLMRIGYKAAHKLKRA